jgi:predicted RNase H-like HicB family nuclease
VPALEGCHAIMETRDAVLDELQLVFEMIQEEFEEKGASLPADKDLVCA